MRRQRKLVKLLFNRVTLTALMLLVEVVWLVGFFWGLAQYAVWINTAFSVLSVLMALYIVSKDDNPAYKIGWIIVIGITPLFGGLMYLFFGNKRPSKKMRTRIERTQGEHIFDLAQPEPNCVPPEPRLAGLSSYLTKYGPYPAWEHTAVEYFPLGEAMYARMLEDLERAEHFIFVEYFIIAPGKMWNGIFEILKRKAAAGVDVRLIYDDFGCITTLPHDFVVQMEKCRIHCIPFNPMMPLLALVMNHRDHRKIMVVDGNVAYTGGVNLADEYINEKQRFGHWKDTAVRLEGDGVWNFTVMFLNFWNAFRPRDASYDAFRPGQFGAARPVNDGIVQPYSDSPLDDESLAENVYRDLLAQSEKYVYIFTPYLVIGDEMLTALKLAAKRGVDVRIVTPGIPDKKIVFRLTRSYYPPLLKAGVRIYEYTPGFLHAKSYVTDDRAATVGSINMDYRSLFLHFECGTLLMHNSQIEAIRKDALETIAKSREITLDDCHSSVLGTLLDDVLRVLSPLC